MSMISHNNYQQLFNKLISAMPEDWRPGLTFHVLPWNPVVVAAVVGVLTLLVFLWRTVLPVQVLVDEAKLQEDALKAHVLSFEKDNCALKEQKKSLLQDAKDWQKKHVRLSEEIKGDHNTQTELENALVHKENEIEVLSGCIAKIKSLEACNDEELRNNKNRDRLKLHLKQIMDVSRIKATLSVINNERNRWFRNFMAEQKVRQQLEEEYQKVMQDQTDMKNEKAHLKNQYKDLQQRLEITTEFYHQKENILHQKLTQEELKHREKESKLSEVEGRTLQAEEELNLLRQKVKDMQEEMQQNERSLKAEIAVQEKKAHENWLKARASERTLIEEKRECVNLRQKIVKLSNKMSDLQRLLYRSGPPERHMPPLQRDMSGPCTSSPHTQDGSAYGPPLMGRPLPPPMPPPNAHYQPMIPPGPPFGADPRFRPPHIDFYRPPFPLRPYGPVPPRPFVHGPHLKDFPSMGPALHFIHEFPPNFPGPFLPGLYHPLALCFHLHMDPTDRLLLHHCNPDLDRVDLNPVQDTPVSTRKEDTYIHFDVDVEMMGLF
ncbi:hypothetical protein HF521_008051 [Silurus meridionalis]|uniref:Uncharacterized protein n=1 Tax=Silurus meridionalis TaxID=175797 RepID=A0A8T0ATB3_SILME|nr:hypothetical protein HF521_008051 [Silurus meridionalis]